MVAGEVGKLLVHGERPHESAIRIGDPTGGAPAATPAEAPALEPISGLLAAADSGTARAVLAGLGLPRER